MTSIFLNQFAKYKREYSLAKVVAITGSAGKTSLKNLIKQLLKNFGKTYSSPKSFNNHFGVPISLSNLSADTKYGVFEVGMSMTGVGGKLSQKSGYLGSFFSGFLATVVATPCMAPFLGVAVGAALAMPWLSSFTVFTCIAIGLSAPYLLLSIFPKWISRLPKPGAWMDTLKQAMAFPLYATVAWLLWTLNSLI